MYGILQLMKKYWWVILLLIGLRVIGQSFFQFANERMTDAAVSDRTTIGAVIVVTSTSVDQRTAPVSPTLAEIPATPVEQQVVMPSATPMATASPVVPVAVRVDTPLVVINDAVEAWQPRRYIAGMQIASATAFQEALLDAVRQRQSTFRAEVVGDEQDIADVYAIIENYWQPRMVITLELVSIPLNPIVEFQLNYQTIDPGEQLVQQRVAEIVAELITPGMHPHQQVRVLHDWVVLNTAYDTSFSRYGADDILRDGMAVCNGYALLLEALLTEAGFNALFVTGTIRPEHRSDITAVGGATLTDGGHAWNMVQLDGQWYHLDATWDDPVPDEPGRIMYNYYLLTDEEVGITRTIDTDRTNFMRPIATTPYVTALAMTSARDAMQQQALRDIWYDTNLVYVSDEYVFGRDELARFDAYVAQHNGGAFVFRARSKADVKPLVERYVDLTRRGVLYSQTEFVRTTDPDDILVEVNFDD
ncbi:MAG: transglutaminase domain-containing protein [Chloroflexota bacterium]|jgi:transglutaminase-like putative cysteine protease